MKNETIPSYALGKRRVAIVGVGYVGASIAYALTIRELAHEIILIDTDYDKAMAEAKDIQHGIPCMGTAIIYAGDYSDCADCDLIIITAGRNRRPDETRLNMTNDNLKILRTVVDSLSHFYTRGAIMIISNPVDILVYQCSKWMGLQNGMIFGTGCVLDTSRLISNVAEYVGLKTEVVKGFVVGEHGDTQVPIWSRLSIAGVPMKEYCDYVGLPWEEEQKMKIAASIQQLGTEIIRGKGRTHYGISTCVCHLADAVLNQRDTIASVSSTLQGEYGIRDVAMSLPSIVGVNGIDKRLEENWSIQEINYIHKSSMKLKEVLYQLGIETD